MSLIQVRAGVASREPLPDFLVGLAPESLADLSWTDPSLGVQDCAWWPADDQSPVLGDNQAYGDEMLTVDAARRVVVVVRAVVALPPTEAAYETYVQQHLDGTAWLYGYDNLISAITYADEASVPAFQAEGQAFRAWRSLVWAKCRDMLAQYKAGQIEAPTLNGLVAVLPALGLPPPVLGRMAKNTQP